MQFLVSTDHFGGPPPPPEQFGELVKSVKESVKSLNTLLERGNIKAGGLPAGQRKHVFIVEAESAQEVTDILHGLPFYMAHKWEITPLESWSDHLKFLEDL